MKGIWNLLARAKLIDLSDEERLAAAEPVVAVAGAGATSSSTAEETGAVASDAKPAMAVASPPAHSAEAHAEAHAGAQSTPLADIFALAGVPESPYPAEKLLRLLDGLRAMDAGTRKAAVLAMDAADDNWQIDDCVRDADFKIAALEAYKRELSSQLQSREQESAEVVNQIKLALDNSTAAIRTQISELDQLREREVTRAAQETTSVEAGLRAARESAARETRRLDAEIERLREISANFKAPDAAAH